MNDKLSPFPIGTASPLSATVEMVERSTGTASKMGWWYRFSAPPEPALSASLKQREAYRRGKLISIALLMQIVVIIVVLFTVGIFVNHALIPNLAGMLVVMSIAVFMNRRGNVIAAGILAVLGLDLSLMGNLFSYPQLTVFLLPFFDLLVFPELFAVSLLPPRAVFIEALFHIAFIVAALTFLFPQSKELHDLLQTSAIQDALVRPIAIQVLVAVISYLWVTSATQAIARADRATTIAALERSMAEQAQLEAERKRQLEADIQHIVQVHAQVANGDFSVRVPTEQGNTLWEVAVSLNNLLGRVQRYRQDSQRLQQLSSILEQYFHLRNQAQNGIIPWKPTGTVVDALVQQHNAIQLRSAPRQEVSRDSWQHYNQTPRL